MTAQLIDGKAIAAKLRDEIAAQVRVLPFQPVLRVVRVGFDPASEAYVRLKDKYARQVGIDSVVIHLEYATTAALVALVQRLNADPGVDGVLVQLPLPSGVDAAKVLETVDPDKDVDGLHPVNVGRLWRGRAGPRPCTPAGVLYLIDATGVDLVGAQAVVVGRSHLVGKPVAAMLLERHATVTLCHSRTRDLASVTRRAEVLVVAIGKAASITPDMIRPGAVVIDVGVNRVEGRLLGDVAPGAEQVAGFLTPVPGGVGPMTVAMLMANTVRLALERRSAG